MVVAIIFSPTLILYTRLDIHIRYRWRIKYWYRLILLTLALILFASFLSYPSCHSLIAIYKAKESNSNRWNKIIIRIKIYWYKIGENILFCNYVGRGLFAMSVNIKDQFQIKTKKREMGAEGFYGSEGLCLWLYYWKAIKIQRAIDKISKEIRSEQWFCRNIGYKIWGYP